MEKITRCLHSGVTRVPCARGQKGILRPCFHSEFCSNYKNDSEIWCFIRVANESRFGKEQRRRKINKEKTKKSGEISDAFRIWQREVTSEDHKSLAKGSHNSRKRSHSRRRLRGSGAQPPAFKRFLGFLGEKHSF